MSCSCSTTPATPRSPAAAAASVPICTEQPGTPWFNLTAGLIRDAPIVIDINPRGVDAIRARGHEAMHLQLGGVPSMRAAEVDRDLDLLFLGGSTPRRAATLASLGPLLWDREVRLRLFRFSAPVDGTAPGTVFGDEKYAAAGAQPDPPQPPPRRRPPRLLRMGANGGGDGQRVHGAHRAVDRLRAA